MFVLLAKVREAGKRLSFLMDYALISEDDIRLNSMVFNWPGRMEPIFDMSQQRLAVKREKSEEALKER